MVSLIDLIIATINNLIVSFSNMNILTNFSLFGLLLITVVTLSIIDVIRRLAK